MTPCILFTYGSLLSEYPSALSREIHRACGLLGPARIAGHLLDLGQYPALVYDPQAEGRVEGELLDLKADEQLLAFLDAYEGYDPRLPPGENLYQRRRLPLEQAGGQAPIEAWVYVWQGPSDAYPRIPHSNYLDYFWRHENHRRFARRPH